MDVKKTYCGISSAELIHGRRLLHRDQEVEIYQLNSLFGSLFRHWLVFDHDNYFVAQGAGEFTLYEKPKFSYRSIDKK